jgi:hypothetical protein
VAITPANFAKVDERVWRGARPDVIQARWLIDHGVRKVINLEWEESGADVFGPGVTEVRIRDFEPLPWFAPSLADEHVIHALTAIRRNFGDPITYVHCRSGQNRTGVVIAAYLLLERGEGLGFVLRDFAGYRGWWAWGDARYIRSLWDRRVEMVQRVANLTRALTATSP